MQHERTEDYVMIIKTENDIQVETIASVDLPDVLSADTEGAGIPGFELIPMSEFNRRLDEMVLEY
ncbi:hypothetical protein [Gorillibacterium sp. sgz500922]|uniref:hypothetical protein n=1 Tax=Gorillibacterium sp. sgz500922 TaxID=3446694 RepID=UPI003F680D96